MVVPRDFLVDLFRLLGVDFLDELRGTAGVDAARLHVGVAQDDGPRRDDGSLANDRVVEDDGPHADQGPVLYLRPVDRHVVPDRHVVADLDGRFLIKRMQDGPILDVHPIPDADGVDVAPQDGVEPDAAALPDLHVTDDGGVVC